MSQRPALLIDVDGPLNPYAAPPHRRPQGYQTHRMRPIGWQDERNKPLRVWLNPTHGPALAALPFDLVWATTWAHEANEWIAPHIGLRQLPVIEWPEGAQNAPSDGLCWKTKHIVEWAQGRPFAWIDDDIEDGDRAYVTDLHDGPALLHWVNPYRGLTQTDFETLADWASTLTTEGTR